MSSPPDPLSDLDALGLLGAQTRIEVQGILDLQEQLKNQIYAVFQLYPVHTKSSSNDSSTNQAVDAITAEVESALERFELAIRNFIRGANGLALSEHPKARLAITRLLRGISAGFHDVITQLLQVYVEELGQKSRKKQEDTKSLLPGFDDTTTNDKLKDDDAAAKTLASRRQALARLGESVAKAQKQRILLDVALRDQRLGGILLSPAMQSALPLYTLKIFQFLAFWALLHISVRIAPRGKSMNPVLAFLFTTYAAASLGLVVATFTASTFLGHTPPNLVLRLGLDALCTTALIILGAVAVARIVERNKYFQIRGGDPRGARDAFLDIMTILALGVLLVPFGII